MRTSNVYRTAIFCAGLGLVSGAASAASFSFTGTFNTDDQRQIFSFLAGPGSAVLRTWGYAGSGVGTNAAGHMIAAGGFDPVLSLFGPGPLLSSTQLLAGNDNGGPSVLADPVSLEHFDSFIDTSAVPLTLTAGQTYFLVLTESPSLPLGQTFGDGFSGDGQGNYTGSINGCANPAFCDADGNQRTGAWAVDITGVTSAQNLNATPEPGSLWLAGLAMAGIVAVRRRKVSSVGQPG